MPCANFNIDAEGIHNTNDPNLSILEHAVCHFRIILRLGKYTTNTPFGNRVAYFLDPCGTWVRRISKRDSATSLQPKSLLEILIGIVENKIFFVFSIMQGCFEFLIQGFEAVDRAIRIRLIGSGIALIHMGQLGGYRADDRNGVFRMQPDMQIGFTVGFPFLVIMMLVVFGMFFMIIVLVVVSMFFVIVMLVVVSVFFMIIMLVMVSMFFMIIVLVVVSMFFVIIMLVVVSMFFVIIMLVVVSMFFVIAMLVMAIMITVVVTFPQARLTDRQEGEPGCMQSVQDFLTGFAGLRCPFQKGLELRINANQQIGVGNLAHIAGPQGIGMR